MASLTTKDIEDFALGEVRRWIARRQRQLAQSGRVLHAVAQPLSTARRKLRTAWAKRFFVVGVAG